MQRKNEKFRKDLGKVFSVTWTEEFEVAVGSSYSALDTVTNSVNILFKRFLLIYISCKSYLPQQSLKIVSQKGGGLKMNVLGKAAHLAACALAERCPVNLKSTKS